MPSPRRASGWFLAATAGVLFVIGSCTINPATGRRQLTLLSEAQEIEMGRRSHPEILRAYGAYPDEAWQKYVQDVGAALAAQSERPDLAWTFTVLDDPAVNAMALPGGYVYVNRGILALFNSEAELASVLGHEIGHVTARHSVEQISRMQLANLGLGVASVVSEDFREYSGLAGQGVSLLFLKFSRDDERQADHLGLRYMTLGGYDPHEMPKVFHTLDRVSAEAGGQSLPNWLSTHPNPGNRASTMDAEITQLAPEERGGTIGRDAYLSRLDSMVYGANPREGYAVGRTFYHPDLEFRLEFPTAWQIVNQRSAVGAVSPQKDAVVVLTLSEESSTEAAARAFFSQQGIERGAQWRAGFDTFHTIDPTSGSRRSQGIVGFVDHGEHIYQLLGYSVADAWSGYQNEVQTSLSSFGPLRDRKYLDVEPQRIQVIEVPRSMTLEQFAKSYPSTVDTATLALINGVAVGSALDKGALVKRVVGGTLPED